MGANFIDEMRDNYLAHFGKKGQTWYVRNYQSYETVPTRSGKVGVEHLEKTQRKIDEVVNKQKELESGKFNASKYRKLDAKKLKLEEKIYKATTPKEEQEYHKKLREHSGKVSKYAEEVIKKDPSKSVQEAVDEYGTNAKMSDVSKKTNAEKVWDTISTVGFNIFKIPISKTKTLGLGLAGFSITTNNNMQIYWKRRRKRRKRTV